MNTAAQHAAIAAPTQQYQRISQYWLPVDYESTDPQFDSRWYTFGFILDVVTNCKVLPG